MDPAEIPATADVAKLGQALAVLRDSFELMACFAAYTGLRWGELAALTFAQVDQAARVVTVDRKVIKIGGKIYLEAPKGRKQRRTIYPRTTPQGYLCVPRTSSMSCDQAVFVDQVTDAGLFSDVVPVEIDRLG